MTASNHPHRRWRSVLFGLGMLTITCLTGCQIDAGGQTLPSPWYLQDDVQYFPAGPEMKLSREAAAQKAYAQEQATQQR